MKKPQHPKQNPKVNEYSCRVMKPHSAMLLALSLWNMCSSGFSPEELTELLSCSFLLYYFVWVEILLSLSGMEDVWRSYIRTFRICYTELFQCNWKWGHGWIQGMEDSENMERSWVLALQNWSWSSGIIQRNDDQRRWLWWRESRTERPFRRPQV